MGLSFCRSLSSFTFKQQDPKYGVQNEHNEQMAYYRRSVSFKVIEIGINRKRVVIFLLLVNSNLVSHRFGDIEHVYLPDCRNSKKTQKRDVQILRRQGRKYAFFSPVYPSPFSFEAPAIVVHLRHDSWSQKLESLWHPAVETANRMIIQLLVLTHYQHVTDR